MNTDEKIRQIAAGNFETSAKLSLDEIETICKNLVSNSLYKENAKLSGPESLVGTIAPKTIEEVKLRAQEFADRFKAAMPAQQVPECEQCKSLERLLLSWNSVKIGNLTKTCRIEFGKIGKEMLSDICAHDGTLSGLISALELAAPKPEDKPS